jgi:Calcineurin-like phosphoesterase
MKNQLIFLIIGLLFNLNSYANYPPEVSKGDSINDGPYIFLLNNKLKAKWIENNVCKEDYILPENFDEINKNFGLSINYNDLTDVYRLKPEFDQTYSNIDSICVITDIHGEYGTYIDLLIGSGILDKNLNWNFGKGHLVVLGDVFDRGNMVTEILWHLFGLEKQAQQAGGMVHVLLGNHEFMVLRNNRGDVNDKYKKVEAISRTDYADLYSEKSVLGKWLRCKPVVITINDIIFVHAGISMEMVHKNLKIKQINEMFATNVVGKNLREVYEIEMLKFLNQTEGPLWYRGYFDDSTFCESKIDSILAFYGKKHIVVGHTPNTEIVSLFGKKILGADAGIVLNQPGETLIYKNGSFYRSDKTGCRTEL